MKRFLQGFVLFVFLCLLGCQPPPEATTQLLDINGTKLFVRTIGQGPPLFLLHGGPGMEHGYFLPHLDDLANDFQLVYFDQRGMGRSDANVDTATMHFESFVRDIEEIRAQLKLDKIHVLGHSWGGLLAMHYAISHPDQMQTLTLINSLGADRQFNDSAAKVMMARFTSEDLTERTRMMSSQAFRNQEPEAVRQAYRMSFKPNFFAPDQWLDSLQLFVPADQGQRGSLLMPLFKDMQAYDLHPLLADEVKCPLLLLNGDYDATPKAAWDLLAEAMPQSVEVYIPEAGHFPFVEKRAETLAPLREFLLQHSPHP